MFSLSNALVSSNWVQKLIYRIRSLASIPALMSFIWEVFTICSFSVFWLCPLSSSIEFPLYQLNIYPECRRGKREKMKDICIMAYVVSEWKRVQKRRRKRTRKMKRRRRMRSNRRQKQQFLNLRGYKHLQTFSSDPWK